jgi:hypothetical protein
MSRLESKKMSNKEVSRGTQDDLEVLALLLSQNLALRQVVMDRLKTAKQRHLGREGVKAKLEKSKD